VRGGKGSARERRGRGERERERERERVRGSKPSPILIFHDGRSRATGQRTGRSLSLVFSFPRFSAK
jgi:hypothetical protein